MSPSASTNLILGERVCKLLQNVGPTCHVSGIGAAAQAALSIIDIALTVKKNREDFVAIGKTCCFITATLIERVDQSSQIHDAILQQDARELQKQLEFVRRCVKKYGKRPSMWRRIFYHHADKEAIQQCRDRLREALDLFGLQSDIELRKQIAALTGQVMEIPSSQPQSAPFLPNPPTFTGPNPPQQAQLVQNPHYLPAPSVNYSYVQGDVTNTSRDGSFNVSGSSNNINFAFAS